MSSMIPSARAPRAGRRIGRRTPTGSCRTPAGLSLGIVLGIVLGIGIALGACSKPPPLDQVIKCNQFKRLPDGSWITTADVSLDYTDNGTHYQDNFSNGVTLSASGRGHNATLVAGLEKKCGASK
jgi:hypothetical protein